ncbi:MAG: DUF2141 domain-containing protein [Candidatus Dactylopiibacterium sp.]|nr:DUF2141 domain-containing protein [Candidatus Dactylopiibacterium sp.]
MKPILLAAGALLFSTLTCAQAPAPGTLEVALAGVRSAAGTLRVSLYREQDAFRKEAQAFRFAQAPAHAGAVSVRFEALPPGRYAVMAYHDENANDKLDLRMGMFPLEGYGLSNNPKVFGPPAFADSAFEFVAPATRIDLQLKY